MHFYLSQVAFISLSILCGPLACTTFADSVRKTIYSEQPATEWTDGLVAGNGMIGVMEFGDAHDQKYVLNSHKFVLPNGAPVPIPDMRDKIGRMQERMLAGEVGEAWIEYYETLKERGIPGMIWTQSFHPGYIMRVEIANAGEVTQFRRRVDCSTGVLVTEWTDDGGNWERTTFSSRTDNVIVTRIRSLSGAKLSCKIRTETAEKHRNNMPMETIFADGLVNVRVKYHKQKRIEDGTPKLTHGGYEGVTRVVANGGATEAADDHMLVKDADELVLLTQLDRYRDDFSEWDAQALQQSLLEIDADFERLLKRHSDVHHEIFDRVELDITKDADRHSLSTEKLLADEIDDKQNYDAVLLEKAFYSSRYLMMASSGSQYGPRLSGMFVGAWGAAWSGDYTCDSNVNMAVMGGGIVDLPECMEGYFQILERTQPQWREAAEKLYGCKGILGPIRIDGEVAVPHHCNEYHAHPTCTGLGAWLIYPMYEHWQITGDESFARERLYPLLLGLAQFYDDFLRHTDDEGNYVFVPSNSPENAWLDLEPRTSASINSTLDIAACKHTFRMLMAVEKALKVEPHAKQRRWQEILGKLPSYELNSDGALAEWVWPLAKENYRHRHLSHMYPVWPAYEINPENPETAALLPAVRKAIDKKRKYIDQMHGTIQKMIGYIRIKEAESFEDQLKYFLENKYLYSSLATSHNSNYKTYNYDMILALQGLLVESIVFSDEGLIELLPALPPSLSQGKVCGIKGRNRTTINKLEWDLSKRRVELELTSDIDQEITLLHRPKIAQIETNVPIRPSAYGDHARTVTLSAGQTVHVTISW